MIILKSGLIFLKEEDYILISPYSDRTKRILSDKIDEIWNQMKYIYTNNDCSSLEIKNLLSESNLLMDLNEKEYNLYEMYSRNIQSLSDLKNNPFNKFNKIINSKILIIGAGTVGSSLIKMMDKYGVKDISVIDGDDVSLNNVTSQLIYEIKDVGLSKVEAVRLKSKEIKNYFNEYIKEDNFDNLIKSVNPEYIFCCADDQSLKLQNLLIDNINKYNYKLFIAGYSYTKIIVNYITAENMRTFKEIFKNDAKIKKENIIYHNTGTIIDGFLSSAFVMNSFIRSFEDEITNSYVFDFDTFSGEKKQLLVQTAEQKFDEYYEDFISYQKDTINLISKNRLVKFEKENNSNLSRHEVNPSIEEFHTILSEYNIKNGNFTQQYMKSEITNINRVREKIKNDVHTLFADRFVNLVNIRKNSITRELEKILKNKFNVNFMDFIILSLSTNKQQFIVDSKRMLEISIEKKDDQIITFEEGLLLILSTLNSNNFSKLVIKMLEANLIDYEPRKNKTTKNMTIYNPNKKISNIIINYEQSIRGLMTLCHELVHAYIFNLFKNKLNITNFREINSSFWEILANVGELIFLQKYKNIDEFLMLSQYNLTFCILDYLISKYPRDFNDFDEIISIKQDIVESLGLNRDSMYYIEYNLILFSFLYGDSLENYDFVYQDIISIAILEEVVKRKMDFDDFFSEIEKLEELSVEELLKKFNLNIQVIAEEYFEKVVSYLRRYLTSSKILADNQALL